MKEVWTFSLIFMFLLACSSETVKEDEVKKTILRYNTLLAKGYSELNMTPLREVAAEMQAEKEYIHMAALGEGKVRMLSELKSIEFLEVSVTGSSASVRTKEVWDYSHININTNQTVDTQRDIVYSLRYDLVKEGGRWLVSSVKSIDKG